MPRPLSQLRRLPDVAARLRPPTQPLAAERGAVAAEHSSSDPSRSVAARLPDVTFLIGPSGGISVPSAAFLELLGHPRDTATESQPDLAGAIPAEAAQTLEALRRSLRMGATSTVELELRHRDGRPVHVEAVVTNLGGDPDVDGLAVRVHDITRWKALERQLTRQAFHDALTGLPNRTLFIDRLEHALGRRHREGRGAAVLFIDLDDFKSVNDSLGHVEGDLLIALTAARLSEAIRPEDTAARLGGDEFALLLDDVDAREAALVAGRVLASLERPFELTERALRVGASVGLALSSPEVTTATDLLRAADIAMYQAKDAGKGQYRAFDASMQASSASRLRLGVDIRGALERGQIQVQYQPIVLVPGGTIVALEAVARWAHPERGIITPEEFMPLAESTGVAVAIGETLLREACRQARAWQLQRPGQSPLAMHVDVSGVQLRHPGLVHAVTTALAESGLPPDLLTLEIAERTLGRETEATIRRLRQLKSIGVGIAIEEFGTGYSSLGSLRRFPIDTVKIDRSFIDGIATSADELALIRAIVRLAQSLGIRTVADGVALEIQVQRLSSIGCDRAQGYLFGAPLTAEETSVLLAGHVTISLWTGHSGHELDAIKAVVTDFEAVTPGIRVDVVGGMGDDAIIAALHGEHVPQVITSFESDHFGAYGAPGAMVDLGPLLERDGHTGLLFTDATDSYTTLGTVRWAMPLLADTYGLYFNRQLLAQAGLTTPPTTINELTEYAKRLTRRYPDGSLEIVGFDPVIGFYENFVGSFGHLFGAKWVDAEGRSSLATDPAWEQMLRWQKALVDWYGFDDLQRFHESVGEEFSPTNAFATGRLAMMMDGEWRTAFLAEDTPELDYGTVPMPVVDDLTALYGSGYVNGTVVGIPQAASHPDAAWRLVRYLAADHRAQAKLASGLRNLPSLRHAIGSDALPKDPRYRVFLDIYAHPLSATAPITALGSAYQDRFSSMAAGWQAGTVHDLPAALRDLDRQIDAEHRDTVEGRSDRTLPRPETTTPAR